jgi:hypothetical protein
VEFDPVFCNLIPLPLTLQISGESREEKQTKNKFSSQDVLPGGEKFKSISTWLKRKYLKGQYHQNFYES